MNPSVKDPESVLIIGCGDIGYRVARLWQQKAIPVLGLARSQASATEMEARKIRVVRADLDEPQTLDGLPARDSLIYYFAPPPNTGVEDSRMVNFLASLDATNLPARIVSLSTSGVYGDHRGSRVDEDTPPNPQVDRARRRLHGENTVRDFGRKHHIPVVILRVGGIYGPGRLPLQRLQQRIPIVHEHLAPRTNRIHADDLAQVCLAAAQRGHADRIYNASDGCDSNMTEYFNTIADYFGLPHPPTLDWDEAAATLSAGMMSYLRESRHMDNHRMREELGVKLMYPDLESGLSHCE